MRKREIKEINVDGKERKKDVGRTDRLIMNDEIRGKCNRIQ